MNLVGGQNFRTQILAELNSAGVVISEIWKPASVQSDFMLDEADHAKREGKLIPVRVPELDPHHIPMGHRQAQTYLLSERHHLLTALQARGLSPQPAAASAPAAIKADERLWQEVRTKKSPEDVMLYLRTFPSGAHAAEADDRIWSIVSSKNTVASYRRYRELLPEGRHCTKLDFSIVN